MELTSAADAKLLYGRRVRSPRISERPLGVVYTPPGLAMAMARLAVEPFVRAGAAAILALRVCDPALGEGAFLRALIDVLGEHLVTAWCAEPAAAPGDPETWATEARRLIATRCVFGVDIDARAVGQARAITGASAVQLQVADALTLDWAVAFPAVFAAGGFDVVIGNPPYIRQERLEDKAALRRYASYDGVADLYVYFVELAPGLLRPEGRYVLVLPNKWMTAAYGRPLRTLLAATGSVEGLVDLGRLSLFAAADAFPCVLWGRVGAPRSAPIHAVRVLTASADPLTSALRLDGPGQPRERWGPAPWHIDGPTERALLDRLEAAFPPLADHLEGAPARGVVTGCNRAFVLDRATRDRLLALEPAAGSLIRPLIKGRDVRSWRAADGDRWILLVDRGTSLEQLPATRAHLASFRAALEPRPPAWTGPWSGRKPGSYAWFELQDPVGPLVRSRSPRLLYQDIQTSPACCLDPSGDLVPDTTVWILPSADPVLLALLNSPLYAWYARRRFPPALNGAVRPKLAYLRLLPVPLVPPDLRSALTAAVSRRLALAGGASAGGVRGGASAGGVRGGASAGGVRGGASAAGVTAADHAAATVVLDAALAALLADAFALSRAERALVAEG